MSTTILEPTPEIRTSEAAPFKPGLWTKEINVRNFILNNYEPYYGDGAFLAGATKRTQAVWKKLTDLFPEERRKGGPRHLADPQLDHRSRRRLYRQGQ